jgi:hypothetical protein
VLFFSSEFSENDTILHPFVEICMWWLFGSAVSASKNVSWFCSVIVSRKPYVSFTRNLFCLFVLTSHTCMFTCYVHWLYESEVNTCLLLLCQCFICNFSYFSDFINWTSRILDGIIWIWTSRSCTSKFMNKHSSPSIISYFFCSSLDFFAWTKEQQRGKTTEILGGK